MRISFILIIVLATQLSFSQAYTKENSKINDPNGFIELTEAPSVKFAGQIFLLNDWDGGDKDNQNAAEEMNRNSKIKENVLLLSDFPNHKPKKVVVNDLIIDAGVLAEASKTGKIVLAMGGHSRHILAWLTALPANAYNFKNITIVTHSNWNELDGKQGYEKNKISGDPELIDTHGEKLRRGLYLNLAKIHDLGVTIYEIPRTDHGPGGWGGALDTSDKKPIAIKALDISDLGLVHYLKTGLIEATTAQRNAYVSDEMKKTESLESLRSDVIARYWSSNRGVPGNLEDYQKGGKYYKE